MAINQSAKIMSGARALVQIEHKTVGIFNAVSWGLRYDTQAAFLLGRLSAVENQYTAQEIVGIQASGWRVVKGGPHKVASLPALQDLLTSDYITMQILDRASNEIVASFKSVRATGYSTSLSNRSLEEVSVTFEALLVEDEDTVMAEAPGSADLPTL